MTETTTQQTMFEALKLKKEGMSIVAAEVSDEELLGPKEGFRGLELCFGGCARFQIEDEKGNSLYGAPMEVWHAIHKSARGNFLLRSIRGRSNLASRLRTQVLDAGLSYVNVDTGELTAVPGEVGRWTLVRRLDGKPALLFAFVKIDRTAGRYNDRGGGGRRVNYLVESQGILVEEAVACVPALLPLVENVKKIALDPNEDESAPVVEGKTVKAAPKKAK